jgi:hypothetical protein
MSTNTSVRFATSVSLWPHAHGLHDHDVEARRFHDQRRLARVRRDAAEDPARGRRPDEGRRMARELFHARLVAEHRAPGNRARRIHREHRHAVSRLDEMQAERLDQRRLADAGRPGDAHAQRLAGMRQELGHHLARKRLMIRARRFRKRNRLRENAAVGGAHARYQARTRAHIPPPTRRCAPLPPEGAAPWGGPAALNS